MGIKTFFTGVRFSQIALTAAVIRQFDSAAAGKYLGETLGTIPGVPSKFQQFLSFKSGQNDSRPSPMPLGQVREIIEKSTPKLAQDISEISPVAETASLGQVHAAQLSDGRTVAIKIMYPGVKEQIDDQLSFLIQAAKRSPAAKYAFDSDGYDEVLRAHFARETNYVIEAEEQEKFFARLSGVDGLVVPRVYREYSRENVLTQSFEESTRLRDILKLDQEKRFRCAEVLTKTFARSLFQYGVLHADLQPGNWGFRPETNEVVLYDFGAVLELSLDQVKHLYNLIELCLSEERVSDPGPWLAALTGLGFDSEKLKFISDELATVCQETFASMTRMTKVTEDHSVTVGEKIDQVLGSRKWWLRTAGPPWFFLLLRASAFFYQTLSNLNLEREDSASRLKSIFDSETVAFKGGADPLVAIQKESSVRMVLSKHLNVLITQGNDELVSLQLPARAVDDLESFVSTEVMAKAKEAGFFIPEIKVESRRNNYAPRKLVDFSIGSKTYKVWLD